MYQPYKFRRFHGRGVGTPIKIINSNPKRKCHSRHNHNASMYTKSFIYIIIILIYRHRVRAFISVSKFH
jgi:hypothetical protein